jgi:DNA replication and repair protein RecF
MSLVFEGIEIQNFRNHQAFAIQEPKSLIIVIGKNASGKTNIIEAIQLITMIKSFRSPQWTQVVANEQEKASIEAHFKQNERIIDIKMEITEGRRAYFLNGKKKNVNEICGLIPGVIFIPEDLNLVKNSSEARRDLIDDIGQQLSQNYCLILSDYKKTVKQRNNILKEQREGQIDQKILESWDENLIILGAMLSVHRIKLYRKLIENAAIYYEKLVDHEKLTSRYNPSFKIVREDISNDELFSLKKAEIEELLRLTLNNVMAEERARIKTLVGPHRDEIQFFINDMDARVFASQGQQRSIALALKLGQLALIKELSGNQPILLLDDVMSELDTHRRTELIKVIDGQIQTVITATDLSCFNEKTLKNAQIIELS